MILLHGERLSVARDRLFNLSLPAQRDAKIVVSVRSPGLECTRLSQARGCLFEPALRGQRDAKIAVRLGVVGHNRQGPPYPGLGSPMVAALGGNGRQTIKRSEMVRVGRDDASIEHLSVVEPAGLS